MSPAIRTCVVLAATLLVLPTACADPAPGGGDVVVADSAGVRIVSHPAVSFEEGAQAWAVGREPDLVIGDVTGDGPYLFDRIMGVERLGDGRWAVADMGSSEIRYFDAQGTHLASAGRQGEGPGEFRQVMGLIRLGGDTLAVDDGRAFVHLLDGDGAFVGRFAHEGGFGGPSTMPVGALADGSVVTSSTPAFPQRLTEPWTLASTWHRASVATGPGSGSVRLELADTIGTWEVLQFVPGWRESTQAVQLQAPVRAGLQRDGLVVADPMRFEVRRYDAEGVLRTVVRFDWDPVQVTPDLIETRRNEFVDAPGEGGGPVPPQLRQQRQDIAETWTFAPHLPAFSDMHVDGRDHVWLREYVANEATAGSWVRTPLAPIRWIVLDPEGRWVARVRTPEGFAPLVFGDELIGGLYRDELGVEQVRVYRMERTGNPGEA
jgi:hypothetical protein